MAESEDEGRTEEPTEKKINDELDRGNTPLSREAHAFASVGAMLIVSVFLLRDSAAALVGLLRRLLEEAGGIALSNAADATLLFKLTAWETFRPVIPILATLGVAGVLASALQSAPRLVFDRIQPDPKRISLASGWHRLTSARGRAEFLKGVLKLASISIIVYAVLSWQQFNIVDAMAVEPEALPELVLSIAVRLMSVVCIVTVLLLAADLVWSRVQWRRDLRMSRQEIKDEIKQNEGDPIKKARLRSQAQDRIRRNMLAAVPKATLVIANPTHYAIALRYVKEEGGAPVVLSKGQDLIALKIREIAEQHSIPVIEDKLLARSMYDAVEVERAIPPEFYKAVAELIHFLYSRGAQRAAR